MLKLDPVEEELIEEERAAYKMWQNDSMTIKCIMLVFIINEL